MAWATPSSRTTGTLITAAIWNADVVDNAVALRGGGIAIASQAANDFVYASSASQLARLAASTGVPYYNGAAWAISAAEPAAVKAGGIAIASQASNDFIYASSASQLARLAAAQGVPTFSGSAYAFKRLAYANVTVSGSATLNANSFNVASVTYNATGDVTVTFSTAFASTTYAAIANPRTQNTRTHASCHTHAVGSVKVYTYDDAASAAKDADFNIIVIGG